MPSKNLGVVKGREECILPEKLWSLSHYTSEVKIYNSQTQCFRLLCPSRGNLYRAMSTWGEWGGLWYKERGLTAGPRWAEFWCLLCHILARKSRTSHLNSESQLPHLKIKNGARWYLRSPLDFKLGVRVDNMTGKTMKYNISSRWPTSDQNSQYDKFLVLNGIYKTSPLYKNHCTI